MKTPWPFMALLLAGLVLANGCEQPNTAGGDHPHTTVEVTVENFDELVAGDTPVLLDFWAPWCGPCVQLTPTLEDLADEYAGKIIIGKVNLDEQKELGIKFNINQIPALFYIKDGEVVGDHLGPQPRAVLAKKIEEVIAL